MSKRLIKGVNDLATVNPELAAEWHPTKNGNLTPADVTANSNKKVWWHLIYVDHNTNKTFDLEWDATVENRNSKKSKCPHLIGRAILVGFNDLATVNPELAAQWHPNKNFPLTPKDITANSNKRVWWYLPYDDPKTGKHFDFEWTAIIKNRNLSINCPFLTNSDVWPGFNDLATTHPKIAKDWHPTKNGDLKPTDVTANYSKNVWWQITYTEPRTGKPFFFEWEESVYSRRQRKKYRHLSKKHLYQYFKNLTTETPNFIYSMDEDLSVKFTMIVGTDDELDVKVQITSPRKAEPLNSGFAPSDVLEDVDCETADKYYNDEISIDF